MPRYSNTLELGYNFLSDARLEVFNHIPTPTQITSGLSQSEILRRDAWFFMVRVNNTLKPYYFDAVLRKVLPFGNGEGSRTSYSQNIGNGIDQEIIIRHGLGDINVNATVWKPVGNRIKKVECEIFQLLDSNNHIGFWFSDIPGVDEFIASVS